MFFSKEQHNGLSVITVYLKFQTGQIKRAHISFRDSKQVKGLIAVSQRVGGHRFMEWIDEKAIISETTSLYYAKYIDNCRLLPNEDKKPTQVI